MANHKSAIKRHRQSIKRRDNNRLKKTAVRTAFKKALAASAEGKIDEAKALTRTAESLMAKATKKGMFHPATLSRKVSRLTKTTAKTTVEDASSKKKASKKKQSIST